MFSALLNATSELSKKKKSFTFGTLSSAEK
jgi:hypothetical protein